MPNSIDYSFSDNGNAIEDNIEYKHGSDRKEYYIACQKWDFPISSQINIVFSCAHHVGQYDALDKWILYV